MQTFLPYPDFVTSARCLDWRRLGKQRVEAKQILATLHGTSKGWRNHPAVKMWSGCETALEQYMRAMILEWIGRGYKNTIIIPEPTSYFVLPVWFGQADFHASHRSNLLRKAPDHYKQFGWQEGPDLPYVWPSSEPANAVL